MNQNMKSITIHGLDETLSQMIYEKAERRGVSINKTIKILLSQALGISVEAHKNKRTFFQDIFGVWSKADYKEFKKNLGEVEKIDPEDWL